MIISHVVKLFPNLTRYHLLLNHGELCVFRNEQMAHLWVRLAFK